MQPFFYNSENKRLWLQTGLKDCKVRRTVVLIIFLFLMFAGCQKNIVEKPVEVFIDGDGGFPAELVGTWKAEGDSGWEITFEEGGSISRAVIAFGQFELIPGKTSVVPMKKGQQSTLTPGKWFVDYSLKEKTLMVNIVVASFHLEAAGGHIDGNSSNILAGKVDFEANRWHTNWTVFRKAIASTAEIKDFDISTDPNYGETKEVIFKKVIE